jgi:hypothetical protein
VEFAFEAGVRPVITVKKDAYGDVASFRVALVGEWEREGFARAMIAAAMEMLKG